MYRNSTFELTTSKLSMDVDINPNAAEFYIDWAYLTDADLPATPAITQTISFFKYVGHTEYRDPFDINPIKLNAYNVAATRMSGFKMHVVSSSIPLGYKIIGTIYHR